MAVSQAGLTLNTSALIECFKERFGILRSLFGGTVAFIVFGCSSTSAFDRFVKVLVVFDTSPVSAPAPSSLLEEFDNRIGGEHHRLLSG